MKAAFRMMIVRGLLSITFLAGIACVNSGPLSIKENLIRKQNCGQLNLPTTEGVVDGLPEYTDMADYSWLLTVRAKFSGVPFPNTTAFLISPRHVMTSVQVLVSDNKTWRFNGRDIENCCSISDIRHGSNNDVSKEMLNTLELWDPLHRLNVEIVKGRIFYFCNQNDHEHYVPLLLEISQTTRRYPCFINEEFAINNQGGLWVHTWGLSWGQAMKHHSFSIQTDHYIWYTSSYSYKEGGYNRGGPLVHVKDGKPTVIGVKESDPQYYNEGTLYFFNLGKFEKDICEFSGVCWSYQPVFPTESTTVPTTGGLPMTIVPSEDIDRAPVIFPFPSGTVDPSGGDETQAPVIIPSETVDPSGGGETQAPVIVPAETPPAAPPGGYQTDIPITIPSEIIVTSERAQTEVPITQRRETKPNPAPNPGPPGPPGPPRPPRPPRPPPPTLKPDNNNNNNNNGNGNGNGNAVNPGSNGELDSISATADANHANEKMELLEIMIFLVFCFYWI